MKNQTKAIEKELYEYLADCLHLEMGDAIQIFEDYIYIEFWLNGREIKLRKTLERGKDWFINLNTDERKLWVLEEILSEIIARSNFS